MIEIKKYIIKKGDKELGITFNDIKRYILSPAMSEKFDIFMRGQTVGCVDDTCKTSICYVDDFYKFCKLNDIM